MGRTIRDITRQIAGEDELQDISRKDFQLASRVLEQQQNQREKNVYSLHAPKVECIGKGKAKEAILAHHPAPAKALGCGLGCRLMFRESEILLAVLVELRRSGIVGLGLHDGLLVPASRMAEAMEVMEGVARGTTGYRLPITYKVLSTCAGERR